MRPSDHGGEYVIRGGAEGRKRLRTLAGVMRPTTAQLLERLGVAPGMTCLDVGSGGGDVTLLLARLVGSAGRVVGVDIDGAKLELARAEAKEQGLANVEFRSPAEHAARQDGAFDVAYARFLLTHLTDPEAMVAQMLATLRPGGTLVVEDIDCRGHFSQPRCEAFERYIALYTRVVEKRGADPNIGPRLPGLLVDAGCREVGMHVVQPAGMSGDVKLIAAITMENVADALLAEEIASRAEIDEIVRELHRFAQDPRSVMSLPRIVQAWGQRFD